MEKQPDYVCEKCGWNGPSTNALFPMHPPKNENPRCPKCFMQLKKK